jgi:tetratricopeptide (TPR) repeat protein
MTDSAGFDTNPDFAFPKGFREVGEWLKRSPGSLCRKRPDFFHNSKLKRTRPKARTFPVAAGLLLRDDAVMTAEEQMDAGHTALAMGEMAEAAQHYRKATQLDPNLADAWQSLGMALVKLEKLDEAIEVLQKLVQLKPKDQLAYSSLSLALGRAGKIKEAEEAAAKAKVAGWGGDPTKIKS